MGWTLTDDLEGFLAAAGGFLRDPVRNTVALTVTENMRGQGPGLYDHAFFAARISAVYTPAGDRRRGYAAAVSRAALMAGATDVVLFTGLADPTSNGVYQRIGYRLVEDRVVIGFT